MLQIEWHNLKCPCSTYGESLNNLRDNVETSIRCTVSGGTAKGYSIQAAKVDDGKYICSIIFHNGSEYAYPGFLNFDGLCEFFSQSLDESNQDKTNELFITIRRDWRKLQNCKGVNFALFVLILILGAAAFYYFHTYH